MTHQQRHPQALAQYCQARRRRPCLPHCRQRVHQFYRSRHRRRHLRRRRRKRKRRCLHFSPRSCPARGRLPSRRRHRLRRRRRRQVNLARRACPCTACAFLIQETTGGRARPGPSTMKLSSLSSRASAELSWTGKASALSTACPMLAAGSSLEAARPILKSLGSWIRTWARAFAARRPPPTTVRAPPHPPSFSNLHTVCSRARASSRSLPRERLYQ